MKLTCFIICLFTRFIANFNKFRRFFNCNFLSTKSANFLSSCFTTIHKHLRLFSNFYWLLPLLTNFYAAFAKFSTFHQLLPTSATFYQLLVLFTTFHQLPPTFYQLTTNFFATNASFESNCG